MAGFLGFMAGQRFTVGFSTVCAKYVMNFVQIIGKVLEM